MRKTAAPSGSNAEPVIFDEAMERAAIGAALISADAAAAVCTSLEPSDFFSPINQQIFRAVKDLHHAGGVDVVLVRNALRRAGKLADDVVAPYLVELADAVASASNADFYARSVAELARKRKLRQELLELADRCANGSLWPEIVKELESLAAEPQTDEGWIGKLGRPIAWAELAGEPDVPWICEDLVARHAVTQFVGLWKAGKTTYLAALLHHLSRGGMFGGLHAQKSRALVITEEPQWVWARRAEEFGGGDGIDFWCRPFAGRASWTAWEGFIRDLADYAKAEAYDLVVFDSMPNLWPVENENDAGEMARATVPMQKIAEAGTGVVLVHHPRKGDGNQGQAARGSGAFAATVDIIVELRRFDPSDLQDRRRVISILGRFGSSERVIEWRGGSHFAYIGDKEGAKAGEIRQAILSTLKCEGRPLGVKDLLEVWPKDDRPSKPTLQRWLTALVKDGEVRVARAATKGRTAAPALYEAEVQSVAEYDPFAFDDEPDQMDIFDA